MSVWCLYMGDIFCILVFPLCLNWMKMQHNSSLWLYFLRAGGIGRNCSSHCVKKIACGGPCGPMFYTISGCIFFCGYYRVCGFRGDEVVITIFEKGPESPLYLFCKDTIQLFVFIFNFPITLSTWWNDTKAHSNMLVYSTATVTLFKLLSFK